jgi:predicted nucleotidyltransferase
MSILTNIDIPQASIDDICQQHHVRQLALFGYVLRNDFTDESDIDILVAFEQHQTPGFFGLLALQEQLSGVFQRRVDLSTLKFIHPSLRERIVAQAQVIYDGEF